MLEFYCAGFSSGVLFAVLLSFALASKTKWRPIKTAPKDGTRIVALDCKAAKDYFCDGYQVQVVQWSNYDPPGGWGNGFYSDFPADYWIPIPQLPER